jgi:hypothetical protein
MCDEEPLLWLRGPHSLCCCCFCCCCCCVCALVSVASPFVCARPLVKRGGRHEGPAPVAQTSALLVPYDFLTEKEKASSINSALEMVRCILYLG